MEFMLVTEKCGSWTPLELDRVCFNVLVEAQHAMAVERTKFEAGRFGGTVDVRLCSILDEDTWTCEGQ